MSHFTFIYNFEHHLINNFSLSQSFKKSERLCHVKVIESLFDRKNDRNKSLGSFPILMIYHFDESVENRLPRTLFSVPKKKFKRAVDRNIIKRRMKEAYRLNKSLLESNYAANIAFLYTAKEILDYSKIEASMVKLIKGILN